MLHAHLPRALAVLALTLTGCSDDGSRGTATQATTVTTPGTDGTAGTGSSGTASAPTSEPTGSATDASASAGTGTGTTSTTGEPGTGTTTNSSDVTGTTTNTTGGDTGVMPDCLPPDALILLDRTQSMHRTPDGKTPVDAPGYASSKWAQAIAGIEAMTAAPIDGNLRFGLELWPRDPGGGQCITLAERIEQNKTATNPMCETGEIVIEPAVGNGAPIAATIDPATTLLCNTTPTGAALIEAGTYLAAHKEPDREQYAILVTDGADWDFSCPDPSPLGAVQDLAEQGVDTFIVGFNGEEAQLGATQYLNDLACAGRTAKGFPGPCVATPDGFVALDGGNIPVYLQADNAEQLGAALESVAGEVCCGCEKACDPPEVLFALDRTLSMHRTPDGATPVDAPAYASSKWSQAITAIEGVVTAGLDKDLRFGLELWPRDPGGGQCLTLEERIKDSKPATNPQCEAGEILVPPGLSTGATIDAALDPLTTHICVSTPTGTALLTASDWLVANAVPGRRQYVVLVTDGADWDLSCPDPSPFLTTQKLAAAGIQTYVVGFFGAEAQAGAVKFMNDMACAGQTAKDFAQNCVQMGSGYQAKDPNLQTPLYLQAGDNELPATLTAIADEILQFCQPG
jgi:Mg-chelatase subunit ChlD